jgi:RND family efflux transporter MFP subunit
VADTPADGPTLRPRLAPNLALALPLVAVAGCWGGAARERPERPVPVEVARVEEGPLTVRRTFHGSLEASSRIEVSTMAGGRVSSLPVDLGDPVRRGDVVATLDRDDYAQSVRQAAATRASAEAELDQAEVEAELAERELERVQSLFEQGAASGAELDTARTTAKQRQASVAAARAEIDRSRAALASSRIRLGDAAIVADWSGDDEERIVAERFVDEGTIVAPNTLLLSIVDLDPLRAVTYATERDYAKLRAGQPVTLRTDAFPTEPFEARVARVAPVFDAASRQARIELSVPNPDGRLKPGLFVRAEVVLDVQPEATTVPADALVTRDGRPSVFVVGREGDTVSLRPVEVGLRDGDRVEVTGEGIEGLVVVLGQQLLHDGATVTVVDGGAEPSAGDPGDG